MERRGPPLDGGTLHVSIKCCLLPGGSLCPSISSLCISQPKPTALSNCIFCKCPIGGENNHDSVTPLGWIMVKMFGNMISGCKWKVITDYKSLDCCFLLFPGLFFFPLLQ